MGGEKKEKKRPYQVEINDADQLVVRGQDEPFLTVSAKAGLFRPTFKGEEDLPPTEVKISYRGNTISIQYSFKKGVINRLEVLIEFRNRYFTILPTVSLRKKVRLATWNVFSKEAAVVGADQLVVVNPNPKSIHTTGVFDKVQIGDQYREFYYEQGNGIGAWFVPLPVNYWFIRGANRDAETLFLGLDDVTDASRWGIGLRGCSIQSWHMDFGGHLDCAVGKKLTGPRWIGIVTREENPFSVWKIYTDILERMGKISKVRHPRPKWWNGLNYITWGDQHIVRGTENPSYNKIETNLTEEKIWQWVGLIEKHKWPIRSITIDGYWCKYIGDWQADPRRFANMRKLVDALHRKGFRVLFWFCPFEADRESQVFKKHPSWFVTSNSQSGTVLELGQSAQLRPKYDYTHPGAREHLRKIFRRMLSSQRDCYNGDGIKADFYGAVPNAGDVRSFHNPSWGIGVRGTQKVQALMYNWAKKYKSDCRFDGETGNPFFTHIQDTVRAWDWCHPDYLIYDDRVRLASVLCPGIPVCYDEHIYFRNLYRYLIHSCLSVPLLFNVERFHGDMHKLSSKQYRNAKLILDVCAALQPLKADISPGCIDRREIRKHDGNLLGIINCDDTMLICRLDEYWTVVLVNDTDIPKPMTVVIDPMRFGMKGKVLHSFKIIPPDAVVSMKITEHK